MNATRTDGRRSAFTLIELLVVIGLMAVLATVSVAGYSAASRGMADRGAIQSAASTLRVAQQACQMDRVPTKVLFFNQLLSKGDDADSATIYQGTAIAIKQAGRITVKPGATGVGMMLVDEFADWNQSYPVSGGSSKSGMLIFRMASRDESKGINGCSSVVDPYVTAKDDVDDYMIQSGSFKTWCGIHAPGNNVMWGLKINSGLTDWKSGDPYGIEIARIDLPKGYIFGSSKPTGNKLQAASVAAVTFDPEDSEPSLKSSVPISLMRPNKEGVLVPKLVGTINATMLKDTFK